MKISILALPALLAGATASMEGRRLNEQFLQAMNSNPKIAAAEKKGRAEKIRELHENLIRSSRKLQDNDAQNGYQQYQAQQEQYAQYQQQAYEDQQQYYENQAQWQNQGQVYADVGTWDGQYWEFDDEVPFDLTARAFKYSGCAAIKSYDTDLAYDNGNPMTIDTFAVFRLCPADKCNKYSVTGCGKNYGEYAIEMKVSFQ